MSALTDLFPVRRTSVWGGFRANDIIPIRYGPVRGACVEYQTANKDTLPRTRYVWSDGACAGIDEVYVDGQRRAGGWVASNRVDVTGAAVMMIEFGQPVPQGSVVSAAGRGRMRNGRMLRNPGDVIADLLAYAGITAPALDAFAIETQRLGIELAGEIATEMTIQRAIRSVCESVGAMYSARIRGAALIYPGGSPELVGSDPRIRADIEPDQIGGGEAELAGICNALSIKFAMRDGSPAKVMDLECPASIALYGRRADTMDAHWITDDGVMASIGMRMLGFRARPALTVSIAGVRADLRPGDYIRVDADRSPVPYATGIRQLVSINFDAAEGVCSGQFEVWSGDAPKVIVVRVAPILEDTATPQAGVQRVGQTNQVTLAGEGGQPLGGAKVILDGRVTRYADGAGIVTFPLADTPPGPHTLTVFVGYSSSAGPVAATPPTPPPAARGVSTSSAITAPTIAAGESGTFSFTMTVFFP